MAIQTPNVVVYQEYENINVAPDIPDLEALIVGPCYQLLDYADDKTDIFAANYGLDEANSPFVGFSYPEEVLIASLPEIAPGAVLDADSVRVFLDTVNVVVTERAASSTPTALDGLYTASNNQFQQEGTGGGTVSFFAGGVQVGDKLIVTSPNSPLPGATPGASGDYIRTVQKVGDIVEENSAAIGWDTCQAGDTVVISGDTAAEPRNGSYTLGLIISDTLAEIYNTSWIEANETTGPATSCTIDVKSPSGASRSGFPQTTQLNNNAVVRTTEDFPTAVPAQTIFWRFERAVSDVEIDATDFTVSGNSVTVSAGILHDLSDVLVDRPVSFSRIYTEYRALRTDLQGINSVSNLTEMEVLMGKLDARNPLFVGALVAKANTTTAVQVYGLDEDTLAGYVEFIDRISSERDIYAIAPLTYDTSILAALNNMCETLADPNYALTNGTRQKFRVTLGALDLPTQSTLVSARSGGGSYLESFTAPSPASIRKGTLAATATGTAIDLPAMGVVPGDKVEFYDFTTTSIVYTFTVASILGVAILTCDEDIPVFAPMAVAGDYFRIYTPGAGSDKGKWEVGVDSVTDVGITGAALTDLFLVLDLPNANFLTNGTIPGDLLQIPTDPETNVWTTYYSWVIDEVISETRVRVVNNGPSTSVLANELPHLYKRSDGSALTLGQTYARAVRTLTKDQQVDALVAVANSFASKRLVLSFPNLVDISGLTDGSIPRTGTSPEPAVPQPGYYLACAAAGQTAGRPPQQAFTQLGIAAITRLYNSSDYFREEQLSEISNGGINIYTQANENAIPSSVHSVTTDITSLEFSEYMIVKDFDFIAWTNLDTLLTFIGQWNVNPRTIEFIRTSLQTTNNTLKERYVAKLGAPLTDFSVTHVGESDLSADRIEAFVDVDLPAPLNTIGLHLVA